MISQGGVLSGMPKPYAFVLLYNNKKPARHKESKSVVPAGVIQNSAAYDKSERLSNQVRSITYRP